MSKVAKAKAGLSKKELAEAGRRKLEAFRNKKKADKAEALKSSSSLPAPVAKERHAGVTEAVASHQPGNGHSAEVQTSLFPPPSGDLGAPPAPITALLPPQAVDGPPAVPSPASQTVTGVSAGAAAQNGVPPNDSSATVSNGPPTLSLSEDKTLPQPPPRSEGPSDQYAPGLNNRTGSIPPPPAPFTPPPPPPPPAATVAPPLPQLNSWEGGRAHHADMPQQPVTESNSGPVTPLFVPLAGQPLPPPPAPFQRQSVLADLGPFRPPSPTDEDPLPVSIRLSPDSVASSGPPSTSGPPPAAGRPPLHLSFDQPTPAAPPMFAALPAPAPQAPSFFLSGDGPPEPKPLMDPSQPPYVPAGHLMSDVNAARPPAPFASPPTGEPPPMAVPPRPPWLSGTTGGGYAAPPWVAAKPPLSGPGPKMFVPGPPEASVATGEQTAQAEPRPLQPAERPIENSRNSSSSSLGSMFSKFARSVADAAAPPVPAGPSSRTDRKEAQEGIDSAGSRGGLAAQQGDRPSVFGRLARSVADAAAPPATESPPEAPPNALDDQPEPQPQPLPWPGDTSFEGLPAEQAGPEMAAVTSTQSNLFGKIAKSVANAAAPPSLASSESAASVRDLLGAETAAAPVEPTAPKGPSMLGRFATAVAGAAAPAGKTAPSAPEPQPVEHNDSSAWLDSLVEANFGPGSERRSDSDADATALPAGQMARPLPEVPAGEPFGVSSTVLPPAHLAKPDSSQPPADVVPAVDPAKPAALPAATPKPGSLASRYSMLSDSYLLAPPPKPHAAPKPPAPPPAPVSDSLDLSKETSFSGSISFTAKDSEMFWSDQPSTAGADVLGTLGNGPLGSITPEPYLGGVFFTSNGSGASLPFSSGPPSRSSQAGAPSAVNSLPGVTVESLGLFKSSTSQGSLSSLAGLQDVRGSPAALEMGLGNGQDSLISPAPTSERSLGSARPPTAPSPELALEPAASGTKATSSKSGRHSHRSTMETLPVDNSNQFKELQQYIDDLTTEKYELQRGIESQSKLAATLASENQSLAEDFNQMAHVVEDLKKQVAKYEAEISAQLLALDALARERDGSRAGAQESSERAKALAGEVVSLEEQVLKLRSKELRLEKDTQIAQNAQAKAEKNKVNLERDRLELRREVEAMKEEKRALIVKLRRATLAAEQGIAVPASSATPDRSSEASVSTQTDEEDTVGAQGGVATEPRRSDPAALLSSTGVQTDPVSVPYSKWERTPSRSTAPGDIVSKILSEADAIERSQSVATPSTRVASDTAARLLSPSGTPMKADVTALETQSLLIPDVDGLLPANRPWMESGPGALALALGHEERRIVESVNNTLDHIEEQHRQSHLRVMESEREKASLQQTCDDLRTKLEVTTQRLELAISHRMAHLESAPGGIPQAGATAPGLYSGRSGAALAHDDEQAGLGWLLGIFSRSKVNRL